MKFDVAKYVSAPGYYHSMSAEQLDFHDALDRRIKQDLLSIYYYKDEKGRNINSLVIIDMETGEIRFVLSHNHKVDKAMVKLSDIQSCLDEFVDFIGVCCDYGYLVSEKPKEAAYAAENE